MFGINADTGLIYTPVLDLDKKPKLVGNIVKVNNGTNVLWQNSSGQIIASVFGDFTVYSVNTSIISFKNEIKKINNSIINNGVDAQSAKSMVDSKVGTSKTYNTKTITYVKQNSWSEKTAEKWKLQGIIEGKENSNTNIAIFTDNSPFSNITIGDENPPSDLYLQQAVLVDDNLNPIRHNGNLISYTFENFISYVDELNIWKDASSIQKYGYIGKSKATKQNFIWLTSGIFNAVTELVYDSEKKTLAKNKIFDFQWQTDQDVYTYSYNINENRFFTSNSYTSTNTSIGYIDFDDENLTYKTLVTANITQGSNGDIGLTNILKFSPVTTENKISQTPLVYFNQNDNSKIKGLYLNESRISTTIDLTRKKYKDIQKEIEKFSWYKERMPSSITEKEILDGLIYDSEPSVGSFSKIIEKFEANDLEGTLNIRYKISHSNWWDQTTNSDFYIELTIKGMYSTQESTFSFVSEKNGDSLNDNKLRMQNSFKQSLYPSQVKWEDVCKYFIVSTVKDTDNKIIDFTKDMIELEPNDKTGILKVKVDYSSKLPSEIAKNYPVYETEFSGFQSLLKTNSQNIMLIVSINVAIILIFALSFILFKIKQIRTKRT